MHRSDSETRWVKFGSIREFIYLGKDVIAMASGVLVMFLNLVTREERMELFDSAERGRGASCLAGHPVVPMFATAEKRSRPKIFVLTYPGLRKVSCCIMEKRPNGYLSNVFVGTDYLLTLTDFPNFQIIIWHWKTGECLTSIDTNILDHDQRIACSPSSPHLVSQIGEKSGKLAIYEISICSKIVSITPSSTMNNIVCASWTSDGSLIFCDSTGNVSLITNDGKKRFIIVRGEDDNQNLTKKPLLESFRNGVILVNRKSQIVFYRKPTGSNRVKSGSPWKSSWSVQAASHPICISRCPHRDVLVVCTDRGQIFEANIDDDFDDDNSTRLRILFNRGSDYKFVTCVNPFGDHVVAIDGHQRLDVLGCSTGHLAGHICLDNHGQVLSVVSHPTRPIIATATTDGKCVLINLTNISEPSLMKVLHLHREPLEKIRYSWSGDIIGVAHIKKSKLFLIRHSNDLKIAVSGILHLSIVPIDFLIYEIDDKSCKIFVLARTSKIGICGRNVIIYSFDDEKKLERLDGVVELSIMLDSMNYGRSKVEIVVVPYLTRQLHFIGIQDNWQSLNVTEALCSGHQMRNIVINVNKNYVVTCGYDGLTIVRSKFNVQQILTIFVNHDRHDGGGKFVVFPNGGDTVVCLGRNGDLVATKISNLEMVTDVTKSEELEPSTEEFEKDTTRENVTWVEHILAMNFEKERKSCSAQRNSIIADFSRVQKRLKRLLDKNDEQSPNSQLPISNFDLDHGKRLQKMKQNIDDKLNLCVSLNEEIMQRDRVSKYLRELCWDSMEIPACSLISIDGKTSVDNFPVALIPNHIQHHRDWLCFEATFEHPSTPENQIIHEKIQNLSITGTTSNRWISKISISIEDQLKKITTRTEALRLCALVVDNKRKLKLCFNEKFEEMRYLKDRELNLAARRIDEIRNCANELKITFGIVREFVGEFPSPMWHHSEKPETVVQVTDDEIRSGRSAILFKRDVRSECIDEDGKSRVKMDDDDFRGEALEIMMDGLLEVRWEDEIKKIPTAPACLSIKDPATYSDDEVAAVNAYRLKCQELKVQRDNYEKLLNEKISSLEESLKLDASTFDRKLELFRLERMKIESAVFQETLMGLRESQRQTFEQRGIEKTRHSQTDVDRTIEEIRNITEKTTTLEIVVHETRLRYENLLKREKLLETKFRGEFGDLKQPIVEHLLRHYRKRPRNVQLTCTSVTWLTEIARCVTNGERSEILPRECLDYLRGMDGLDFMPNNLPAQIDSGHWHLMCKLRRAKVELEIKIKSCAVDLAEADQTLSSHQKSCTIAEQRLCRLRDSLKQLQTDHSRILEDRQVQLVVRMGQMESRLSGDTNDLSNAVLVPLDVVVRANNAIIDAGRRKIIAMRKTVEFRRKTLWREWRHKCMITTLRDMKEELQILRSVKVTREIRDYLHGRSSYVITEKDAKFYGGIIDSTNKIFGRMLEKENKRLVEASEKISIRRRQNKMLLDAIVKIKSSSFKASTMVNDVTRLRERNYHRTRMKAIARRTRFVKKINDHYGELVGMQTQLELLRLKTYPTLRFNKIRDKDNDNVDKSS